MSFRAVTWAFDTIRGIVAQEKLVLVALAEFANDENITWRALEEIAARAECSVRTAKTHLKNLELRGLISRAGRYTWCDSVSEACANRPPHKHRSGTTYTLHLNMVMPLPLVVSEVEAHGVSSTGAKLALVEKNPELQGKVHRCKTCTCGKCSCSTGATGRSPQVQQAAPICNIEPPIKPPYQTTPKLSKERAQADFDFGVAGRGVDDQPVASDEPSLPGSGRVLNESLLLACLPEAMRGLDARGMRMVWSKLAPLLDEGATPGAIKAFLNSGSLPERVSYMPGLVASRLERMVFKRPSTAGLQPVRTVGVVENGGVVEDEPTEGERLSSLVWERLRDLGVASRPMVLALVVQRLCELRASQNLGGEIACLQDLTQCADSEFLELANLALADVSAEKQFGGVA